MYGVCEVATVHVLSKSASVCMAVRRSALANEVKTLTCIIA